ncbi:MAG: DUF4258 domain-containing protein [Saprospiraceae bacterium]
MYPTWILFYIYGIFVLDTMYCDNIFYAEHALTKMAERGIEPEEVEDIIKRGEMIKSYPEDLPDPSCLLMGWADGRVLHVVVAKDILYENCIVVTAYEPDPNVWELDFKNKKIKP